MSGPSIREALEGAAAEVEVVLSPVERQIVDLLAQAMQIAQDNRLVFVGALVYGKDQAATLASGTVPHVLALMQSSAKQVIALASGKAAPGTRVMEVPNVSKH